MMREVVVTGYGIISCLGNDVKDVTESLKNSTSKEKCHQIYFIIQKTNH